MQETVEKIAVPVMIFFFLFCYFLGFQLSLLLIIVYIGNVCIILWKNFFIPEKGLTFAIGGEDSEYKNRDSF